MRTSKKDDKKEGLKNLARQDLQMIKNTQYRDLKIKEHPA